MVNTEYFDKEESKKYQWGGVSELASAEDKREKSVAFYVKHDPSILQNYKRNHDIKQFRGMDLWAVMGSR